MSAEILAALDEVEALGGGPAYRERFAADPARWGPKVLATRDTLRARRAAAPPRPAPPAGALVAPLGAIAGDAPHRGLARRKPWDYATTATLAHLGGEVELLEAAVALLRLQDEPPYILLVDTGSDAPTRDRLEALRGEDLEVHYIRSHAWRHSSEPVAAACDLALDLCKTEYLYYTHNDCLIMRRDWLRWLRLQCGATTPAVGYRMTDRSFATPNWEWMAGHTALMTHLPTLIKAGCRWGYRASESAGDLAADPYWDTETGFNWALRRAGIAPLFVGRQEENFERNTDENIDHVRSAGTRGIYGDRVGTPEYRSRIASWRAEALADARARIAAWSAPPPPDPTAAGAALADLKLARLARSCPYRSNLACGCGKVRCALAGRTRPASDCTECVRTYGLT